MLDRFNISKDGAHIGLLEFSNVTTIEITLNESYAKEPRKDLIRRVSPSGGKIANLDKTLRVADDIFKVENGGRAGIPKVLIIIAGVVGGTPSGEESLKKAVTPLKESGVQVFVISIGNKTDSEILDISPPTITDPADDPKELGNKTNDLVDKIMKEIDKSKWKI